MRRVTRKLSGQVQVHLDLLPLIWCPLYHPLVAGAGRPQPLAGGWEAPADFS